MRIFVENFREPDPQLGYLLGGLTMGQLLSGAMIAGGVLLWKLRLPSQGSITALPKTQQKKR
jgi:phosphatidylglycerol:prolipoprotein diacylglycerol transferase